MVVRKSSNNCLFDDKPRRMGPCVRRDDELRSRAPLVCHGPTGKSRFPIIRIKFVCPAYLAKIFCLSEATNHLHTMLILSRHEGRYANVSNAGRDAVDAGGFLDEESCLQTAKPWGPGTPTLVSSLRDAIPGNDGG
jgi:hypothetical protein